MTGRDHAILVNGSNRCRAGTPGERTHVRSDINRLALLITENLCREQLGLILGDADRGIRWARNRDVVHVRVDVNRNRRGETSGSNSHIDSLVRQQIPAAVFRLAHNTVGIEHSGADQTGGGYGYSTGIS